MIQHLRRCLVCLILVLPLAACMVEPPPRQAAAPVRFPADGARDINPDTRLVLTFASPPRIGTSGLIRIHDTADGSLVDTLDLSVPASPNPNGRSTAANEAERRAQGAATAMSDFHVTIVGGTEFHFHPILVRGNTATIYPHNAKLTYGRTYRVTLDAGVLAADGFDGIREWTFTTKAAPPPTGASRLVVAADGSGDFNTVQGAIDHAPDKPAAPIEILIRNGTYEELVFMRDKSNLTLRGESREGAIVTYPNNSAFNPPRGGPSRRPAFSIYDSNDIQLSTFTIRNTFIGQAEALLARGERIVIDRMTLNGSGDALTTYGSIYARDMTLTGDGDTILGYAALFCLRCEIHSAGPFTWTRTPEGSHGNVFVDSTFIATDKPLPWTVQPDGTGGQIASKALARLPRNGPVGAVGANFPHAEMVLINSRVSGVPPEGFGPVQDPPDFDSSKVRFWEHNTTGPDGKPVDVSQRHPIVRQLMLPADAAILADYQRPEFVLGGWKPVVR
jgi:pectinesterase